MLEDVRAVACVGAGAIGSSWALVFARAGIDVCVYDANVSQLDAFEERAAHAANLLEELGFGDATSIRARLRTTDELSVAVDEVQYIQESVPERVDLKRMIFGEIDALAPPDAVLASSASALSISEIAAETRHPERCIVVHPLNPPHLIPLVEVVPGTRTDSATAQAVYGFMESLGQRPILCRKEVYGFVANRIQMALLREALYLVREGVASVADIDRCVSDGLGLRWALLGPFGVEHTNAESIVEDLRKFGDPMREIFAALYSGHDLLADDEIDAIAAEVESLYADTTHHALMAWRDRKILQLRVAKAT